MGDPGRYVVRNEFVSDIERAQLFSEATVVVLPYVEATQSGVVPVAYSFSKPVVVTAVGGLPEAVANRGARLRGASPRRARTCPCGRAVAAGSDLARRFGATGYRRLAREASAEVIAEKTLRVYAQVAAAGVHGSK